MWKRIMARLWPVEEVDPVAEANEALIEVTKRLPVVLREDS